MNEPIIYHIILSSGDDSVKKEKILAALKNGANINEGGGYYQLQPLIVCYQDQNYDMAEFLIKNGADPWYINSITGRNCVNAWAENVGEYNDLEQGMILFAKYAAWQKPEWCQIYLKLIFTKGWPEANSYISGSVENMRKYK